MAYEARDGKKFGNRQKQQAYDERTPKKGPADEHEQPEAEGETNEPEGGDIHEFVAQHGPANKVEIEHGESEHKVTSHHGGKKHHSTHPNAEAAHVHAAHAAGLNPQEEQQEMPAEQPQGYGSIPGM